MKGFISQLKPTLIAFLYPYYTWLRYSNVAETCVDTLLEEPQVKQYLRKILLVPEGNFTC